MSVPPPPAIIKQKQPGYFRLRFALTAGDLESKDIKALCAITEKYGRGELLCTPRHELEIPFVRESDLDAVLNDIEALAFQARGLLERPNVVACPGTDHCVTAYVRTKKLCNDLEAFLRSEDVVPTIRDLLEIYRETATEGISFGNQFLELGAKEFSMKLQEKLSQRIWFPAI